MSFKIVILSARAANLTPCVQSIRDHEPDLRPDDIIVVDDGARNGAYLPDVRWISGIQPFVFARNANLGIQSAASDIILLNDDARLLSPRGFTLLSQQALDRPTVGLCSAGIRGAVGNPNQLAGPRAQFRLETRTLAFVCVFLPQAVYEFIGPLDEQFAGYGCEDNDYCARVLQAGLQLAVWDGCVVDHSGQLPSTFRTRREVYSLYRANRQLFTVKWGAVPESFTPGAPAVPRHRPMTVTAVETNRPLEPGPNVVPHTASATSATRQPRELLPGDGGALPTNKGAPEPTHDRDRRVDLLYLACNRLEFTRETFTTLISNTDWKYVHELFVYDDGSEDGTREWLERNIERVPARTRFVKTNFGSPVTAMVHFIESSQAPILAKTDNDAMLPPGWLRLSLDVLDRHPELALLGIEAMYPHEDDPDLARSYTPAEFISGLGLYRRAAFAHSRPKAFDKYFGLEEWQIARGPGLVRGWITPAIPVFLLDRFPLDPWRELSDRYIRLGWQRPWQGYEPSCTLWHWRWPPNTPIGDASQTRGQRHLNLGFCDEPLPGFTNISTLATERVEAINFRETWPWQDNSVDYIRAWDLIEHLPDTVFTMNEIWRVLMPGGTVEIAVPTTDGTGAFQDPTHVSFWNRRSFLYYEAGNPYRERFAASYGIRSSFRVLQERMENTVDGPRLIIMLQAIKLASDPEADDTTSEGAADTSTVACEPPRETGASREVERVSRPGPSLQMGFAFLCAMRIRNEAPHIEEVISRALALCEHAFIFDDRSTDGTAEICRSFRDRVTVFPSPFEGLDEARDKNYLLQKIVEVNPAWVLWIDGDEVLERSGPDQVRVAAERAGRVSVYALAISYLWNEPNQVRVDGIYGRFVRPSLFRLREQPLHRLRFLGSGRGGNFHCGNVPRGLSGAMQTLPVRLKHLGYLTPEQRRTKHALYTSIDPNNDLEDNYRHIVEIPGARHAPGPVRLIPWRE